MIGPAPALVFLRNGSGPFEATVAELSDSMLTATGRWAGRKEIVSRSWPVSALTTVRWGHDVLSDRRQAI